jgi:hypothetical protein
MIKQIDNLKLPPSLSGSTELFNRDTQRRTVSGRLITKLDTTEKWRVTVSFDAVSLSLPFQAEFYNKCLEMRLQAKQIIFVSPYDGAEKTITAKCIGKSIPSPTNLYGGKPQFYTKIGAVFEEV